MSVDAAWIPPARRSDLLIKPIGDAGENVVKDLRTGAYFNLAAPEAFLLLQLDGIKSAQEICSAFDAQFNDALTPEDLEQFVEIGRAHV